MKPDKPSLTEFRTLIQGLANRLHDCHGDTYAVALSVDLLEQAAGQLQGLTKGLTKGKVGVERK